MSGSATSRRRGVPRGRAWWPAALAATAITLAWAPAAGATATFERAWGNAAPLQQPSGLGTDSAGRVYLADREQLVKYSPSGVVLDRFTEAGGSIPQLTPSDVAIDAAGNMYVADLFRVVKLAPDGSFIKEWGEYGGEVNLQDFVFNPASMEIDSAGNVYVMDCHTSRHRIQKFDSDGTFILEWGERGSANGEFECGRLAIDSADNVYVADIGNDRVQKFDDQGTLLDKWGQTGATDGRFVTPAGITVDANDNVYVSDQGNNRIQKFTTGGVFQSKWGTQGSAFGQFEQLGDIAAFGSNIYSIEGGNLRVQKFNAAGSFLTSWGGASTANGAFNTPIGLATDAAGNVYVVDQLNDRVEKFDDEGNFLLKWGSQGTANGRFDHPTGITVDDSGNVYVVDSGNFRVQKFSGTGTFLDKWGSNGFGEGEFTFFDPSFEYIDGIATDSSGDVYVADGTRVQRFDPDGTFVTQWDTSGGLFGITVGLAIDSQDDVYVANTCDTQSAAASCDIKKYDSSGDLLTSFGAEGDADGQFHTPLGVAVTPDDEILVADRDNGRIQKFDSDGAFIEKWGSFGFGEMGFQRAVGVAAGPGDEVYVTDSDLHRVQKFIVDDSIPPPPAPTDLQVDTASPGTTTTIRISGVAEPGTQVRLYTNATCTGPPVATGSSSAFSGAGIQVTVDEDSTTTFRATATNLVADPDVTSACSTDSVTYQHVGPPAEPTDLTVTPTSPGNSTTPMIKGDAPAGTTVEIYSDAGCTTFEGSGTAADFADPGIQVFVPEGSTTTFRAVAVDTVHNLRSTCSSDSVTYTQQFTPPAAPTGLSVTPSSPSEDLSPMIKGTAPAGTFVEIYKTAGCSGTPEASGTDTDFAAPGIQVEVAPGSTTTFRAIAVDFATGLRSPCSASSVTYTHQLPPPPAEPTGLSVIPSSPGSDPFPAITGTAPAGTTVEIYETPDCSGPPSGSGSAAEFGSFGILVAVRPETTTTFRAIAVDDSTGQRSPCSASSVTYVHTSGDGGGGDGGDRDGSIDRLDLSGKTKIKPGKKVTLDLLVRNGGAEDLHDVDVTLVSSKRKIKVKSPVTIAEIPADESVSVPVPVKAKRSAKGKATITASVADVSDQTKLKVKPAPG